MSTDRGSDPWGGAGRSEPPSISLHTHFVQWQAPWGWSLGSTNPHTSGLPQGVRELQDPVPQGGHPPTPSQAAGGRGAVQGKR